MSDTQFYFCYSSSLDTEAFNQWKTNHGYEGFSLPPGHLARASGFKLAFNLFSNYWGGRVLGLEKSTSPADSVEGVVFEISSQDWPIIEHKEGVKTGLSVVQPVECELNGKKIQASAFTAPENRKTSQGALSPVFLDLMKKAYKKWGFMTDLASFC